MRRHAFTLIELVVVILLLAVVAGIIVPRLLSTGEREARAEAEAAASLAGAASRRAVTTTQKVALDFADETLRVYALRARDPRDFSIGATRWSEDPLLSPVRLTSVRLVAAVRDGAGLNPSAWRVELGGDQRPELLLTLEAQTGRRWTVTLLPDGAGAVLLSGDEAVGMSGAVDLDRTGRGLSAW
jgi:prepilin-type N-terminal cleavage/methylation domain-containing protein